MIIKEFTVERITIVKYGVNDRGSNGTGSWGIEVAYDIIFSVIAGLPEVYPSFFICYMVYFNKIKSNLGGLSCTRGPLSLWISKAGYSEADECDSSRRSGLTDFMMMKMMIVKINCLKIN